MQEYIDFLDKYPRKSYVAHETIVDSDSEVHNVHFIVSGFVKIYDISKEGEIKTLVYLSKQDIFPTRWLFFDRDKTLYVHEAQTDCEVILIPKQDFLDHLKSNQEITYKYLKAFVGIYHDFMRRVDSLTQLKADMKIVYALDFLCRRFGLADGKVGREQVHIRLPITQSDLANFLGLTRETVSKNMHALAKKGVVGYDGNKTIEINHNKIEELIND